MQKLGRLFTLQQRFKFSTVNITIKMKEAGVSVPIKAPENEQLALVLQKNGIPLDFDCGFCCECATCMVQFEDADLFKSVSKTQPLESDEKIVLKSEGAPINCRLTCQMKVTSDLEGSVLLID